MDLILPCQFRDDGHIDIQEAVGGYPTYFLHKFYILSLLVSYKACIFLVSMIFNPLDWLGSIFLQNTAPLLMMRS